jgi:hypothetical protein
MKAYKNARGELGRLTLPSLAILILLFGSVPVRADLVFDTGYNIFDDSYPYYDEVWVTNDAHLDVLGGEAWKLELTDSASVNLFNGNIELLWPTDDSVVNIYGDTITRLGAGYTSSINLYAYDVIFHQTGGGPSGTEPWIDGIYYLDNNPFEFLLDDFSLSEHINIVPEPATFLLLGAGAVLLRKKHW